MLSKSMKKRIGKYCLIWSLITAVFIAAYSAGMYILYKATVYDEIEGLKGEAEYYAVLIKQSQSRNDEILMHIAVSNMIGCNYYYFGKIEDDGSLTDIYKTDYDDIQLYSDDAIFSDEFSDQWRTDICLTDDADKQGKVFNALYFDSKSEYYKRYYLTCPEDVFNRLKNAQNSGIYSVRIPVFGHTYYEYPAYVDISENETVNNILCLCGKAASFVTDHLTHYREEFSNADPEKDASYYLFNKYDGAYIRRADVDVEAGKILSGELVINGNKYNFPDDNLTDSNTTIMVSLHKCPDTILDNNKELLRDDFDRSYLESLEYEPYGGISTYGPKSGLEGVTYDYKHEDGQAVISGICKFKDGYYRYVYILPYAGFFEAFAPCILEVMLKVWVPGLIVISLLTAAVCRKRY